MRGLILLGVILIVVGLAIFALNLQGIETRLLQPGPLFLGGIGGAFLAAYVFTGTYGFLIPGCILASFWVGITIVELLPTLPGDLDGAIIVGGLGLSFLAIYLVDRLHAKRRRRWPLWPALGLVLLSIPIALSGIAPENLIATLFIAGPGVVLLVIYFWRKAYPLLIPACILIAVGLVIPMVDTLSSGTELQGMFGAGLIIGAVGVAFLAMFVLDKVYSRASNWWPLIPGLILLVIGGSFGLVGLGMGLTLEQLEALGDAWTKLWPLGLIVFGAWLVLRWALTGRRETRDIAPGQDS
jgi:hypothetical protein